MMQKLQLIRFGQKTVTVVFFSLTLMTKLATCQQKLEAEVSPYCNYLIREAGGGGYLPTVYGGSPFKIYTKSIGTEIKPDTPVQVTIGPLSKSLNFFNFTDFILYATPVTTANPEREFLLRGNSPHVGVFQLFDKWRAGAEGMTCNPGSRGEDSVGAFEDRLMATFAQHNPNNPMMLQYQLPARNQVVVLWWPTKEALTYPEIKFVANLKSMGQWFKIQSAPWKINKPVDQWSMTERMLNQFQNLESKIGAMESRIERTLF